MKIKKIITIILIALLFLLQLTPFAQAQVLPATPGGGGGGGPVDTGTSPIDNPNSYKPLLILGIKYMLGSASEKAEYKKSMLPYIIGAFLLFSASIIVNIIASIVQESGLS